MGIIKREQSVYGVTAKTTSIEGFQVGLDLCLSLSAVKSRAGVVGIFEARHVKIVIV